MNKQGYKVVKTKNSYLRIKRLMDIVGSVIALILFSPLMIVVAILIKAESEGPVFFKQRRIGKDKKEFYILKFRSMKQDAPKEVPTHLLESPSAHITKVGSLIRKTSIDELPQLINVLKGEMSLVGPRPALWNQFDLIEERDKYGANDIKPGITGWAQINGRDELSTYRKAALDGEYVKKISLLVDINCLIRTILNVISKKGIVEGKLSEGGN